MRSTVYDLRLVRSRLDQTIRYATEQIPDLDAVLEEIIHIRDLTEAMIRGHEKADVPSVRSGATEEASLGTDSSF